MKQRLIDATLFCAATVCMAMVLSLAACEGPFDWRPRDADKAGDPGDGCMDCPAPIAPDTIRYTPVAPIGIGDPPDIGE